MTLNDLEWPFFVEQFCQKAEDANPLVAEPETDFNAKCPLKVIQGHLFRYR